LSGLQSAVAPPKVHAPVVLYLI